LASTRLDQIAMDGHKSCRSVCALVLERLRLGAQVVDDLFALAAWMR